MYTGHGITLAIEQNGILIGLTDQAKTHYKFIVVLKKIL